MKTSLKGSPPSSRSSTIPLALGPLDHYTLIVGDAAAAAKFHVDMLGFEPLRVLKVNAGGAPAGEFDMLNHVLQLPGTPGRVMVVTEGLTDESIFRRFLQKYGPGVHHVAYEVKDLDRALGVLREHDIKTTSQEILRDPLTGLRQVFIRRDHGGYFIELLERTEHATGGEFTNHNMAALAKTMLSYLKTEPNGPPSRVDVQIEIARASSDVRAFLLDLRNLPQWTGHRTVRFIDGRFVEVRLHGDVLLSVHGDDNEIHFTWEKGESTLSVGFAVDEVDVKATRMRALLPELPPGRRERTIAVVSAELRLLAALLGQGSATTSKESLERDRSLVSDYHMEVYQREGL